MPYNLTEQPEIDDDVEVPEGTDIVARAALIAAIQNLANRTRNLMNRLGGRTGSSNWLYLDELGDPATVAGSVVVPGHQLRPLSHDTHYVMESGNAVSLLLSEANSRLFVVPADRFPSDVTITKVSALVVPGAARAGSDRMRLRVGSTDVFDDGSTSSQVIEINNPTQNESGAIISIKTGADATADVVTNVTIEFQRFGPR